MSELIYTFKQLKPNKLEPFKFNPFVSLLRKRKTLESCFFAYFLFLGGNNNNKNQFVGVMHRGKSIKISNDKTYPPSQHNILKQSITDGSSSFTSTNLYYNTVEQDIKWLRRKYLCFAVTASNFEVCRKSDFIIGAVSKPPFLGTERSSSQMTLWPSLAPKRCSGSCTWYVSKCSPF